MTTNDLTRSRSRSPSLGTGTGTGPGLGMVPLRGGPLAARACIPGTLLSTLLVAAGLFLVPAHLQGHVVAGALTALLAAAGGGFFLARAAAVAPTDPRNGPMFVQSLVLDFAIQLGAAIAGILGLHLLGVKFAALLAFGITYAAVAMVVHVAGALLLSRALRVRARCRESSS